jgi:hypothetical protein
MGFIFCVNGIELSIVGGYWIKIGLPPTLPLKSGTGTPDPELSGGGARWAPKFNKQIHVNVSKSSFPWPVLGGAEV